MAGIASAVVLASAAPAFAANVTHELEFQTKRAGTPTTYTEYRFELPTFDRSLGTLKRVELFWTADAVLDLSWTTTTNPNVGVFGVWAPFPEIDLTPQPIVGFSGLVIHPAGSGISLIREPSGPAGHLHGSAHAFGYDIDDGNFEDLSGYWLSDRLELAYAEMFWTITEAGGGMDLKIVDVAKHKFRYVYTYLPGIPEPSTWATFIVGLGTIGTALRRRRSIPGRTREAT